MHNLVNCALRAALACGFCVALAVGSGAKADSKFSGKVGISHNTHFISYGADVWGGGKEFFGDRSTTFFNAGLTMAATENLSFNIGTWADINNNTADSLGGDIQEVDYWGGVSYKFGPAVAGLTYQRWNYASDVEEIVDVNLGFDDSAYLGKFALNPGLIWHIRTSGNNAQETGSAIVVSIAPRVEFLEKKLSLTFPAGVAFFTTDDFQGGDESGYAYSYLGASLGVPISFIPAAYGSWALNFDVTGYFTESDAIPNNPEENFATGSVGLTLSF